MNLREPVRVLELRSVRGIGGGPEKTILLSAARHNPARVVVTVCYIRDRRDADFRMAAQAERVGPIDYIEVVERHSFDFTIWKRLRTIVRERRIQIVHAHEYKTDLYAYLLAKAEKIAAMATVHGWSGFGVRERFYYAMDKRLLSRYPMVIAVSDAIRGTILADGADPARVRRIHNAIDHDDFRRDDAIRARIRTDLDLPPDARVVGAIGRLEVEKRFDLLIKATSRLPDDVRPFIIIAGEGSLRRRLTEQAESAGLGDRFRLLGYRPDVKAIHHALDVYMQTSDTEGIPNAVLEAMALGTPVVATAVGGTAELVEHGVSGLLVPKGDVPAMTRVLAETLAAPDATLARVAAARARIECEFSFDARLAAIENVYEELALGNVRASTA